LRPPAQFPPSVSLSFSPVPRDGKIQEMLNSPRCPSLFRRHLLIAGARVSFALGLFSPPWFFSRAGSCTFPHCLFAFCLLPFPLETSPEPAQPRKERLQPNYPSKPSQCTLPPTSAKRSHFRMSTSLDIFATPSPQRIVQKCLSFILKHTQSSGLGSRSFPQLPPRPSAVKLQDKKPPFERLPREKR